MLAAQLGAIRSEIDRIRTEQNKAGKELARLAAFLETEGVRCPYRETIARAANDHKELEETKQRVNDLEHQIARGTLAGSALGNLPAGAALVGWIIYQIGQGQGWW